LQASPALIAAARRLLLQNGRLRAENRDIEVNMRHLTVFTAIVAVSLAASPFAAAQVAQAGRPAAGASSMPEVVIGGTVLNPSQAHISGRVVTPNGNPLANATVRARNLLNGQVGGSTSTASAGQFSITVAPGSYLLEVVDDGGQVVGTSSFISATGGTAITSATVTASAGGASAATTTAGLISTLGSTAARSVTYAAAAAGVAGVVTLAEVATASPSR
jgi:hypothetical protein